MTDDDDLERWTHGLHEPQPLSARFPEVVLEITETFAHDRGRMRRVESLAVAGEPLEDGSEVIARLVAARGGWGPQGESDDATVLATVEAYYRAWAAAMQQDILSDPARAPSGRLPSEAPEPHAPRAELRTLPDGARAVTHAQFYRRRPGRKRGPRLGYLTHTHRLPSGDYVHDA